MSWFGKAPLRNTTGQTLGANLVYNYQRSTANPRPGGFHAHTDLASELLQARIEHSDYRLSIATAKAYVASCQAKVDRQGTLPAAQIQGRNKSFLRAVVRDMGAFMGIGLGQVRQAKPEWGRPDRKAKESPGYHADVRPAPPGDSMLLRAAAQRSNHLEDTREQINGVLDLLRLGLGAADEALSATPNEVSSLQTNTQIEQIGARRGQARPQQGNANGVAQTQTAGNTASEPAMQLDDDAPASPAELAQEIATLQAMQHALEIDHQQAATDHAQQLQALTSTTATRTDRLLDHPPGFGPGPGHAELCADLRILMTRLQTQNSPDAQWPADDTLEVVCSALALASKGDAGLASNSLRELMQHRLIDLVPQPGQWFDGSPRSVGRPQPAPQPLENLVDVLLDLPSGAELLSRVARVDLNPAPADQRDAVSVYYKAMRTIASRKIPDSASAQWLHRAALAACHIAHPASSPKALSVRQRAAFHGVRNGLLSVAKASPADQANSRLQLMADEWVNELQGRNPLRARREAAVAATQVGLPTPVRQANDAMRQTCSGLQQTIDTCLKEAVDLNAMEPVVQAAKLLRYIEKHADQHLRLDQMPIDRRAWRSVDRHTARWLQTEGQAPPAPAPAHVRADDARLGLRRPNPAAHAPLHQEQALDDLQTALWDLRLDKVTALQALDAIHKNIAAIAAAQVEPKRTMRQPYLPTIDEGTAYVASGLDSVQESLDRTLELQPTIDAFMGTKAQWRADEFSNWVTPVVGQNSSAVTMKLGHTVGVNTSGISATFRNLTGLLGFAVRVDAETSRTEQQVLRYAKQSRGMEAFIGDNQQKQDSFGLAVGLRLGIISLPSEDAFSANVMGCWAASHSKSNTQGVLLRSPVYDARALPEAKQDFSAMLDSARNWKTLRDEVTGESYSSPLEAVLARHPHASVSTIDQLRTVATTTASSITASVSGGGPFAKNHVPRFFGSMGVGVGVGSKRQTEITEFKTRAGSQAFAGSTAGTTATAYAQFRYTGQLGGLIPNAENSASLRGRSSSAILQLELRRKQAQSSATVIRQPDGTLVGEKACEFNTFEPFKKTVEQRWDAWIERGVNRGRWPDSVPVPVRRLLVEQELDSFMKAAEQSVRQGGTVTLNETVAICPEVCAELSACLALEELAHSQRQPEQARAAFERRQRLLQAETSYEPYKLKAIVQSQMETLKGVNLVFSAHSKKSAGATHEYDSFP